MIKSEIDGVLSANRAFYEAFARRDLELMAEIWAADAPVSCIHPGGAALSGREAVLDSWRRIFAGPGASLVRAEKPSAAVHHDTAVVTCTERAGGDVYAATNVFVKRQKRWHLVHRHAGPADAARHHTAEAQAAARA